MIFLFSINIKSFGLEDPVNGVYQIENKDDLIEFAKIVNGEHDSIDQNISANAILKNNIEFNKDSTDQSNLIKWHKYGRLYADWIKNGAKEDKKPDEPQNKPSEEWTPIGNDYDNDIVYTGTFDGNGFSISGLFCNVEKTGDGERVFAGLFGCVHDGEIKNLGIKNSFIRAKSGFGNGYGGGLIGCFEVFESGKGYVTSSYSKECTVFGFGYGYDSSGNGGGLIGYFDIDEDGTGEVTSSYSSDCTVVSVSNGQRFGNGGGLIGYFDVDEDGTGEVASSYSSGCTVVGFNSFNGDGCGNGGGLIGYCGGNVIGSYSSNCTIVGFGNSDGNGGGLIGYCGGNVIGSYSSCCVVVGLGYYGNGGGLIGYCEGIVTNCYSTNKEIKATGNNCYQGGICGKLSSGTISNCFYLKDGELKGTGNKEDGEERNDVRPFRAELKIPVRVKINYDPSNNLASLVSKNFKHEFFRKINGGGWKPMLEEKQYFYTVSPVENSIKINSDGSKTQDFIFNYYIYQAKDRNGEAYQFGFDKNYPVKTYLREDVGGGKKLYIDYGVFGRE